MSSQQGFQQSFRYKNNLIFYCKDINKKKCNVNSAAEIWTFISLWLHENDFKKPDSVFFSSINNFTLKVFYFSKDKVSVPYLKLSVFHGSSILARCGAPVGEMHLCGPKQRKKLDAYTTNFLKKCFSSQHSTLVKFLRATVHSRCTRGRNLSSECCQTWQDAEE